MVAAVESKVSVVIVEFDVVEFVAVIVAVVVAAVGFGSELIQKK